jgi:hypothetical protein
MKWISLITLFLLVMSCTITDKRPNKKSSKVNSTSLSESSIKITIDSIMQAQIICWNEGDILCFMEAYWKSDSLMFVGKSGINYGWQKTLDNYLKSYSSKDEMGILHFNNEVMILIDKTTFQVIGKWHLKRTEVLGDLQGYYSLIWQIKNGKWVIISDHSS